MEDSRSGSCRIQACWSEKRALLRQSQSNGLRGSMTTRSFRLAISTRSALVQQLDVALSGQHGTGTLCNGDMVEVDARSPRDGNVLCPT